MAKGVKAADPKGRNGVAAFCRVNMGHRVVTANKRSKLDKLRQREARRDGGYSAAVQTA